MNDYEAKQAAKKERYEELAEKNRESSNSRYQSAKRRGDGIPFGQPILVGHHSEAGHRADLKRIDNDMRKSIEHDDKAAYYERKAANVGKAGISSDDPEAINKLKEKLQGLKDSQEHMKRINKIHRAYKKNPASINKHDLTEKEKSLIMNYVPEYSWIPSPFAPYQMQNNNANIKTVEKRIKSLESRPTEDKEETVKGVRVLENVEANRVQLFFDGKPPEDVRKSLRRYGFRWAPTVGAWQRHLNNSGLYAAQNFLSTYEEVKK